MKYFIIIAMIFLAACNPWSSYDNFMYLKKGQSLEKSLELASKNFRTELIDLQYQGEQYKVAVYWFLTSSKSETKDALPMDSQGNRKRRTETTLNLSGYILVFKDDKLITWGYEYEIKRDAKYADLAQYIAFHLDK